MAAVAFHNNTIPEHYRTVQIMEQQEVSSSLELQNTLSRISEQEKASYIPT